MRVCGMGYTRTPVFDASLHTRLLPSIAPTLIKPTGLTKPTAPRSMLPVESERTDLAYRKQQARLQLQARQQQKTQKQNTHQPPIRGQRWRPPVMSSGKKATGASSKAKVASTTAARTGAKGQGAGIASGGGSNSTSPVEKLVHSNGRVLLPKAVHVHSACIVACLARSSLASRIHECPGTLRRLEELTRARKEAFQERMNLQRRMSDYGSRPQPMEQNWSGGSAHQQNSATPFAIDESVEKITAAEAASRRRVSMKTKQAQEEEYKAALEAARRTAFAERQRLKQKYGR